MAKIPEKRVVCSVARHPNTPIDVLEELFHLNPGKKSEVHWSLTSNPSIPSKILKLLEQSHRNSSFSRNMGLNIAEHPNTSPDIQEQLAQNAPFWICSSLAVRFDIPQHLLLKIISKVVNSFFSKSSVLEKEKLLRQCFQDLQQAKKSSTSITLLEKFAKHRWSGMRMAVAKNPSTPSSVLNILAVDKHNFISKWVAKHPNASEDTLNLLMMQPRIDCRNIAVKHPNFPRSIRQKFYNHIPVSMENHKNYKVYQEIISKTPNSFYDAY